MKKIALVMVLMTIAGFAQARGNNQGGLYLGAGVSNNELDGFSGDATGYQVFAGYSLDMIKLGALKSAVEVGYMNSGDFEQCVNIPFFGNVCSEGSIDGVWANYVVSYDFAPSVSGLGRVGLDFGDDDGLMVGAGIGFKLAPKVELRGEYVLRDHIDSLQANLLFRL